MMGATVDILDQLADVRIYAALAPEPLLVKFMREAAITFCERTKWWKETDVFATLNAEECVWTIDEAEIVTLQRAALDGAPLEPKTVAWLDEHRPGWQSDSSGAPARYVTQIRPDTVMVVPHVPGQLALTITLKPSLAANTLPRSLVDHHGPLIGKGAAGRVLTMPGEWANPQLGAALWAEFLGELPRIRHDVVKGQQRSTLRTRPRYF